MNSVPETIGPIPRINLDLMIEAIMFAIQAHELQMRKAGEPYIVHPLRIFLQTVRMGLSLEAIIAAVLHDVVEDTNVELSDIIARFGDRVAELVASLTKPLHGTPNRRRIYEQQLLAASREVKKIKLLDIEDNLYDVDIAFEPTIAKSYREKQICLAQSLRKSI